MRTAFAHDRVMSERVQVAALRCGTMIVMAVVLPAWLTAIPVIVLSLAVAVAIVRHPQHARQALAFLRALLTPP
jgi:hypothetical protein